MKIGILGGAGRMGQMIAREILSKQYNATLSAAVDHAKSWAIGKDIGGMLGGDPYGVCVTTDKVAAFKVSDVLIDFTSPEAAVEHAGLAAQHKKKLVVGTTGLSTEHEAALRTAGEKTAVLYSANMSVGVNLLMSLVEQAVGHLAGYGEEGDLLRALAGYIVARDR